MEQCKELSLVDEWSVDKPLMYFSGVSKAANPDR